MSVILKISGRGDLSKNRPARLLETNLCIGICGWNNTVNLEKQIFLSKEDEYE